MSFVERYDLWSPEQEAAARLLRLIDSLLTIKDAEIAGFQSEVTEWEHREYFEMF